MDIMTRRAMMLNDNYIKDGLVLWMDGIDKGNVSGAWVDKANDHVFTNVNGMTIGENYIELNANLQQYFQNNTFSSIPYDSGTIETVIDNYNSTTIVYMPINGGLAFGIRSTGNQIIWNAEPNNVPTVLFSSDSKTFSIQFNNSVVNKSLSSFSAETCWLGPDNTYNYIGRRNYGTGNYYNGKIYSIRIYNRRLTVAEMLHNQKVDNKRFHLGLIIE